MNGLEHEFERFRDICFDKATPDEVANIRRMFLAGALAQANRIFGIFAADISIKKKQALMRRISRECEGFQKATLEEAKQLDAKEGTK